MAILDNGFHRLFFVADRLLGHASLKSISPTADIYNVYEFATERQAALVRWVGFLAGEEEASSSPEIPQLMLPAPEPVASVPPEVDPSAVYQLIGVKEQEEASEESFIGLILRITNEPDVIRVKSRILERDTFAARFLKTLDRRENAPRTAFSVLAHTAALAHQGGITVFKQGEVEARRAEWTEKAQHWRGVAKSARAEEEQARVMGQEEFAVVAGTEAEKAEVIAGGYEEAMRMRWRPMMCVSSPIARAVRY